MALAIFSGNIALVFAITNNKSDEDKDKDSKEVYDDEKETKELLQTVQLPDMGKQEREAAAERCNHHYSFLNAVYNLKNFSESETREIHTWNEAAKELCAVLDFSDHLDIDASILSNTTTPSQSLVVWSHLHHAALPNQASLSEEKSEQNIGILLLARESGLMTIWKSKCRN